jgi:hypothetical protein
VTNFGGKEIVIILQQKTVPTPELDLDFMEIFCVQKRDFENPSEEAGRENCQSSIIHP